MNNTIEILISAKDAASSVIGSIGDSLSSAGGSLVKWGAALTVATAGIGVALGGAAQEALKYNESITNTAAVLGITGEAQTKLSQDLLDFSKNTRAGAQEVAASYYDIVGGVADASTHMAILTAANKTAEAGNTDLGSTTKALISVMNSYKLSADGAGMASDVLTQVVNKGVGTMGDFASALPQVTGLANSLGISFTDVGSATAFLTTKGNSASQAVTQLRGMMVSLLNPNANMKKGLAELGYENGQAAIKALGLVGAMKALSTTQEAGKDGFASMAGSVEALNGAVALSDAAFGDFNKTFADTAKGATDAAQAIQNASPAAQLDFLNSSVETLKITIGNALLPALSGLVAKIRPVIDGVVTWMQANPELTGTIIAVVGGLVALGPILAAVGAAIMFIASPVGIVIAALAGLAFLLKDTLGPVISMFVSAVKGGTKPLDAIGDTLKAVFGDSEITQGIATALHNIQGGFETLIGVIGNIPNILNEGGISEVIASIINAFAQMFGLVDSESMLPGLQEFVDGVISGIGSVVNFITGTVLPALGQFASWFITDALPAVVSFITGTVVPAVQAFFAWLANAWTTIQPGLAQMADWFLNTALPAVVNFITGTVVPAVQTFFTWLGNAWTTVQPGLQALGNFFINDVIPAVVAIVRDIVIPMIQNWIDILVSVWNTVEPVLSSLANWFLTDVMPQVISFIQDTVIPAVQHIIDILSSIWDIVGPILTILGDWFTKDVLPKVVDFINVTVIPAVQGFINILKGIWDFVRPGLEALRDGIKPILQAIQTFFQPVVDFVNTLISRINDLKGLAGTYQGAAQNASTAVGMVTSGQVSPGQFLQSLANAVGAEISGGHALGIDFVPRPQMAMLHRGERVLTANENAAAGGGGATLNFGPGSVVIQSDTTAGGEAAAEGFWGKLGELMQQSAVTLS